MFNVINGLNFIEDKLLLNFLFEFFELGIT